jgi:hypothetical protein
MFPTIIDDQRYVFIDTPGFNDEKRSDVEIFEEILQWFESMTPYCNLAGILYVHDITEARFHGAAALNLAMLKALCGKEFYKNVTIITTKWGTMSQAAIKNAEKREASLKDTHWKELISGRARVLQHRQAVAEEPDPDDVPLTDEERRELKEKLEMALGELCGMMAYYKTSENAKPTIQRELRQKVGILNTEAGAVLRKKFNLPATLEGIDGDGSSVPSSPSCWTPSDELLLQLEHSASFGTPVHVVHHHHCGAHTPPRSPKKEEKESKDNSDNSKKEGWFKSLWRAVKTFFSWG